MHCIVADFALEMIQLNLLLKAFGMGEGVVTEFASDVSGNGSLQQRPGSRVALGGGVGGKIVNLCGVMQVTVSSFAACVWR